MKGRFVWHDYIANDVQAAIDFYTEVIGWRTEAFAEASPEEPYTMWAGSQGPLGGVMQLSDDMKTAGARPHWMGHVEVKDLDAIVKKVAATGGSVEVPPTPIPAVGRFSVVADPQGATLSAFQPNESDTPHDKSEHGELNWSELHVPDPDAAFTYYSGLFGWTAQDSLDMGPAGKYTIFGHGDRALGGMMRQGDDEPTRPLWLFYVYVDDIEAAIERAKAKGGQLLYGPVEIPGGRMAQLMDPQGAIFGLNGS